MPKTCLNLMGSGNGSRPNNVTVKGKITAISSDEDPLNYLKWKFPHVQSALRI